MELRVTAVDAALRPFGAIVACDNVMDLINQFADVSCDWDVPRAARYGYLHLLQYLNQQRPLTVDQLASALQIAASRGHLCILQWIHTHPMHLQAFSIKIMNFAAFHGHLAIVQWLHQYRGEGCSTKAMDGAACCGHLDVVQWLHQNRTEGCTVDAMDSAAINGHLAVVRYLHEHRNEGCTTRAMDVAAANGDVAMMEFLYTHRTEGCTTHAVKSTARGSRFQILSPLASLGVLKWLYARYEHLFSLAVLQNCVRVAPPPVLAWIRDLGRVDETTFQEWLERNERIP